MAFFPTASASICQTFLMQSGSFSSAFRDLSGNKPRELRGHNSCHQNGGSGQGTTHGRTQKGGRRLERPERSVREQEVGGETEEKKAKRGLVKKLRKIKGLRGVGQSRWEQEGIWKAKGKPALTHRGPSPMET